MVVAAPPDIVPPSVSITAPANGASVAGTTVVVSATASDNVGVVGVQFKLDGANLGAEDTVSPYSISWNTTTVSNGVHSLSAVARDAAGNQTTSATVSVSASTTMRIEETSAAITYSGTWSLVTNAGMYSGGTMRSSMDANARATLSFTGTSVTFITMSDEWSGIAEIYVDGNPTTQVDLYASPAIRQAKAYTVSGLTVGPHTVGIGPTGRKNASAQGSWIQLDAFDVTTTSNVTTAPSPAPTTISGVSGSGTSGSTASLTATLTSGGSGLSGKTISFTLNGTAAGTSMTNSSGVATLSGVSLSGINEGSYSTAVAANFDGDSSYAASSGAGALTVIASTSGSGTSTSGTGSSGSTTVSTSGGSTSTGTSTTMRVEETSAAITYSGTWSLVTNGGMYSGRTMKASMDANARATLSFTGTSVTFITMSDEWSGIAQIYVDGSPATQVDLYASPAIRQAKAYTVSGLTVV